ncbi:k+-dependent Na+/Ca+ exchanger-like protein [Firmicutes bacterium CAG:449]|nr:k+-dependent Na+/Ca+ exchanger-like protein [Firmicutes bacterium CAG:449]
MSFMESWPVSLKVITFILALIIGIFCLVKFCDIFVDASCSIAKKLHISELIIGLTIVAMGTSCPELAVSVSDSISTLINGGNANVAIGNVVGSNICNLLLVLGASCLFTPIIVKKSICKKEYPFLIGISILLVIFVIFFGLNSFVGEYVVTRIEGIIFVLLIGVYIYLLIKSNKTNNDEQINEEVSEIKEIKLWKSIILVIVGCAGIIFGGEAVVFGAKGIALEISDAAHLNHDLAESLIGLTIVAVGTSLPELVTSVVASKKGQNELALGNVIGSNIFNTLFVLGISATVNPLTSGSQIVVDVIFMLVATLLVFVFALKGKIGKVHGYILLCLYLGYLAYLVTRTII